MRRFAICGCAPLLLSGLLNAQLSVPKLGFARFSDGSIHAVHGLAANLIVDPRPSSAADGASFSDFGGLASANGLIQIMDADGVVLREYESGETQPILNMDSSLQSAVAWLPSRHLLLGWDGAAFTKTAVDDSSFGGKVAFVKLASGKVVELFVERADSSVAKVSVSLTAGRVMSSDAQPGGHGAVFVQQDWVLSQSGRGLTAELPNGNRQAIELSKEPLPADDLTIERMSNDWLHISSRSTGTHWAVYWTSANTSVSLLPPPTREKSK
jgi:hypothetical protein